MGGTSTPTPQTVTPVTAQPVEWYNSNIPGLLNLSNSVSTQAATMTPEMVKADIPYLQDTAYRESVINALNSAALEKRLTPEVAQVRDELDRQMAADATGGPSRELSNLWLKQGLNDVIATGADTKSGFARSALVDKTREDYHASRMGLQDRMATYLAANPMPTAGLDPGSLSGIISQVGTDNVNLRNAHQQQVLGYLGNNVTNVSNAFNQAAQAEAALRAQNASAVNSANAQNASAANSASATNASNNSAMWGSAIGAGGAVLGGAIAL
jgi:hypothetical protein